MNPEAYAQSIKDIESGGGNYGALGPVTKDGDQAYGAYQVMGNNIPDWTEKHYGQRLTPDEFLKNKEAQDAVFHGQFGSYVDKYGNPQDAASAWFTGQPIATNGNASDGNIRANQYVDKFNQGLAKYGDGSGVSAISNAMGLKPRSAGPALGFANEDDEEDDPKDTTGQLSVNNTVGPGALSSGLVMKGDAPSAKDKFAEGLMGLAAAFSAGNPDQANALNAQLKAMRENNQSKYKFSIGKDGRIYRMDDSGNVNVVGAPGGAIQRLQHVNKRLPDGSTVAGTFDPSSGKYQWEQNAQQANAANGLDADGLPETLDDLKKLNPTLAQQAQQVNTGQLKLPTSSYKNPENQRLRKAVAKFFPDTSEDTFAARNAYAKNFGSDQPSQPGGQAVGLGHSLDILDQLGQNYVKQNNFGPVLGAGTTLNAIKNAQTFGGERSANANAGADLAYRLSTETGRLYSGNQGGGVHEREDTMKRFGGDSQNLTPTQQAGMLREQLQVLTSRQEELEGQRDHLFGGDTSAANRFNFRNDKTQKSINGIKATLAVLDPNGPEAKELSLSRRGAAAAAPSSGTRPPLSSFF